MVGRRAGKLSFFCSVTADDSFYAVPREQYFEDLSITSYTFVNLRKWESDP